MLALPRGGVPVAYEVATALRAPLDVLLVRKLGVPGHEELAFGAIASGDVRVLNDDVLAETRLESDEIDQIAATESRELARREQLYRGDRPPADIHGRAAVVVDDGLATGATMRAAVRAVRRRGAAAVMIAVPVASRTAVEELRHSADAVVCIQTPDPFVAVGLWYRDFAPVTDAEVRQLLDAQLTA